MADAHPMRTDAGTRAHGETAALIVGAAPADGASDVIGRLAATSTYTIAADAGAAVCLDAGVMPDVVIGDFDSLGDVTLLALKLAEVPLITHPPDKDRTDLGLALDLARERHATAVIVTCAFADRLDHTLAALGAVVSAADLAPVIVEPAWTGWLLSAQARSTLQLRAPGATLSLLALAGPARVSAQGVRWPLEHAILEPLSDRGVSNVGAGEVTRICVHEGSVLVTLLCENPAP